MLRILHFPDIVSRNQNCIVYLFIIKSSLVKMFKKSPYVAILLMYGGNGSPIFSNCFLKFST